jgi:hypothetical protein
MPTELWFEGKTELSKDIIKALKNSRLKQEHVEKMLRK